MNIKCFFAHDWENMDTLITPSHYHTIDPGILFKIRSRKCRRCGRKERRRLFTNGWFVDTYRSVEENREDKIKKILE